MYPIETSSRAILNLDGIWKFKLDHGEAEQEHWERAFPEEHEELYVPASYNDQREDPDYRNHTGKAWYQRSCTVPSFYAGQRLFLRFDAVTHDAVIFLNGTKIMEHRGGFLPFETEITERVHPGETFTITVSSDNRINHSTLPIGNEEGTAFFGSDNAQVPAVQLAKAHRGTVNMPNFDFFNYAGIQRHVRLYTTPMSYIRDITLIPDICMRDDGHDGILTYKIELSGPERFLNDRNDAKCEENVDHPEGALAVNPAEQNRKNPEDHGTVNLCEHSARRPDLHIEVLDADGNCVAASEGTCTGTLRIPHAKLWEPYPGTPYLYTVRIRYGEDVYLEETGIRTVRVEGTKFLINGKPFYFKGFGKHEDFYIHGRGTDGVLNVKDVGLLHWLHANSFRTSHYPYAEEMYRLCDREGIVIIDETPAVGIGAGPNLDPYTFPIREYHKDVLRELIQRDKNHPSVVLWSMGNEPDTEHFPESAYAYWRELYEFTHQEDPSNRPVTFVCCQNDYTRDLVTRTMDVVCINRYYGWYNLSGDLDSAVYAWQQELSFWAGQQKPVMVTEYGCDTLPGLHGSVAEMWTEEFQKEYYRRIDEVLDQCPFFIGEQLWAFSDFNTLQGVFRADGNRKGLFTRERRPKLAAHWLRERWNTIPNFYYKK